MSDGIRVFIVLFAAVNPAAVMSAAHPLLGCAERRRVAVLAFGIALAVLVVVAALAGDALDAIDISPETFRIAAGIVMLTAAVYAVARAAVARADFEPGLRAAVFPLAIPLLVSPASVIAAASYGADQGVGVVGAAAAVALGLAAVLVGWLRLDRAPALVDAAARLTGALLAVLAVGLIVDGVRAI